MWDSVQSVLQSAQNLFPKALPSNGGVPVFVMLPLDAGLSSAAMSPSKLDSYLDRLASIGVHGAMVDVWWGACEPAPGQYDFSQYVSLAKSCQARSLKLQVVMSFHACGGNVGDSVNVPLPEWVVSAGDEKGFWFTDQAGRQNKEYISFGADHEPVLPNGEDKGKDESKPATQTPLQAYAAFIKAFMAAMEKEELIGSTITELQIGFGPCGELRYPGYPMPLWDFPGIGQFQCYDKFLARELTQAAAASSDDAVRAVTLPPSDAGTYNDRPSSSPFFTHGWKQPAGRFFLDWYSQRLLQHGADVLQVVRSAVPTTDTRLVIAMKISGIHWWKFANIRAAEATSGYIDGSGKPIYAQVAGMLKEHKGIFDFTCLEMRSMDQPLWARCGPKQLVNEVFDYAWKDAVPIAGENALQDFSDKAFNQILSAMRNTKAEKSGFTLLRLCDDLMEEDNLKRLEKFVVKMKSIDSQRRQ